MALVVHMPNPITCTECGAIVVVRDGVAYTPDTACTLRHHCTRNTVPAWMAESVEYAAFEASRPVRMRVKVQG